MTTDSLRPALAAYLATHRIKLVHVWQSGRSVNAMLEWPYDPTARKALVTEKHVTGAADDPCAAVIRGLDLMGHCQIGVRLFLISYMLGMIR